MRREFIVIALLGVLLGYLIYDSFRDDPSKVPVLFSAAKKEDAVPISRDQMLRVELLRDNYIVVVEKGRNGKFEVKSPVSTDVDRDVLDRLLAVFEKMEIKKALRQDTEEIPLIMSEYGLDRPPVVWRFTDVNQVENTFLVGKETPERDGFYAKWKDREEILVLPKKVYPALDLSMKSLRDKEIFTGLTDTAVRQVSYGGLRFVKGKDGWAFAAPFALACDQEKMGLFIEALRQLRAQDFVHKDLKGGEEGAPADTRTVLAVVTGDEKGKEVSQQVVFGGDAGGNRQLATVYKNDMGYVIRKDALAAYPPEARAFIDARFVPFEKAAVGKITVGDGETAFSFVKQDGRWSLEGMPAVPVDAAKVGGLAALLTAQNVTDILPFNDENARRFNLMPPEYIVKVNDRVTLALSARDKETVYFLRDDSKNVIGKALPGIQGLLSHDLNYYRERSLLRVDPNTVTKVSLTRGGREIGVERTGGEWKVVSPLQGKIPQGSMLAFLRPFEHVRAVEFAARGGAVPEAGGLDKPFLVIRVTHDGREDVLSIGAQKSGRFYYASLAGVEGVFLLNRKSVKPWDTDLLKQIYLVEEDANRDTIVDTWTYFDNGRKTKMELDVTNDGKPDVVSNFIYNGDGTLAKIEADNNDDGKTDQTTFFANGVLEKEENDADYNGTVESITYYKGGKQYKSEIDTSGDGKPDIAKYYTFNEKGELTGAGVDQNMDGKIDYREQYEKGKIVQEKPAAAAPAQNPVPAKSPATVTMPPKVTKPKPKEIEL